MKNTGKERKTRGMDSEGRSYVILWWDADQLFIMAHCKKERRGKSAGFFFFFFFFFFQISSNKPDDKALATYQVTFPCCSGTNLYKDKISGIQEKGI